MSAGAGQKKTYAPTKKLADPIDLVINDPRARGDWQLASLLAQADLATGLRGRALADQVMARQKMLDGMPPAKRGDLDEEVEEPEIDEELEQERAEAILMAALDADLDDGGDTAPTDGGTRP